MSDGIQAMSTEKKESELFDALQWLGVLATLTPGAKIGSPADAQRHRAGLLLAELQRLRALETRLFQMIAMGDEITVEAFTDLAEPDTATAVDERRERAAKNVSPWTASGICPHGLPKSVVCSVCLAKETLEQLDAEKK